MCILSCRIWNYGKHKYLRIMRNINNTFGKPHVFVYCLCFGVREEYVVDDRLVDIVENNTEKLAIMGKNVGLRFRFWSKWEPCIWQWFYMKGLSWRLVGKKEKSGHGESQWYVDDKFIVFATLKIQTRDFGTLVSIENIKWFTFKRIIYIF